MRFSEGVAISPYRLGFCFRAQKGAQRWYCNEQILRFLLNATCRCLKSVVLAVVFTFLVGLSSTSADTHYVNVSNQVPQWPFTSIESAATTIQEAIDVASPGDTVLVAAGVYNKGGVVVHEGLTNRIAITKAITVKSFAGPTNTLIVGRGPLDDSAVRCAYLGADAVLSGFTLTNGHTRSWLGDSWTERRGGGVWCQTSSAILTNCVIIGNFADDDGGGAAGGTLNNCQLLDNTAGDQGGGAYHGTLTNCKLMSNSASYGGGAFGSNLTNCKLTGNSADKYGGGASSGTLSNSTLTGNTASRGGGGVYQGILTNCKLIGNSAPQGGGAFGFGARLNNSTLTGNSADFYGGGAMGGTLTNCTLTGNSAGTYGGGAYDSTINNCIVYYNSSPHSSANYHKSCTLQFTCTTPLPPGEGNLSEDPLLAGPWHLSSNSPCIATGNVVYATGIDIDGDQWLNPPSMGCDEYVAGSATGLLEVSISAQYTKVGAGFEVDFVGGTVGHPRYSVWSFDDGTMVSNRPYVSHAWELPGTYEIEFKAFNTMSVGGVAATTLIEVVEKVVHYVNASSKKPSPPFTSWETAATTIQEAIDVASAGDIVLVTNGTYDIGGVVVHEGLTNRIAITNAITVESVHGPENTLIVGQGPTGDSAIRCAYVGADAVLSGFTLTNGHTRSSGDFYTERSGGGVWCEPISTILTNCVIIENSADRNGGGAYRGTLNDCKLVDNTAISWGGGARMSTLNNCILTGNSSIDSGGGGASGGTLNNCALTGNSAFRGGGVFGGTLNNCTLTGNAADDNSGGAYGSELNNCIVYYNSTQLWNANYDESCTLQYTCTTPLPAGEDNNIADDPLLAGPWHLSMKSRCIEAGNIVYTTGVDIDGDAWLNPPSIGCNEYVVGSATDLLEVSVSAQYTQVVPGVEVDFIGGVVGHPSYSVWSFDDGIVVSNRPYVSHAWERPGTYEVEFIAFNTMPVGGVAATTLVEVVEKVVHYVNVSNQFPSTPFTSWGTAATTIQEAIDVASAGDVVLVTNGIYDVGGVVVHEGLTNRIAITNAITVESVHGPETTLIVGQGPAGNSAVRCAYLGADAVLSGFTLTNGHTRYASSTGDDSTEATGGGVWCESISTILTNCVIIGNFADEDAGGAYRGTLIDCRLEWNTADFNGGGAHSATLFDCTLGCNTAVHWGGGAYDATLTDCTLTDNSADLGGGATQATLTNCTVTGNTAEDKGGGVSFGTLNNCIVFFNEAASYDNYYFLTDMQYSCITPLPDDGTNNITSPPLFIDLAGGDYRLAATSPCIDAGKNEQWMLDATDIEGNPRVRNGTVDMGAHEFYFDVNLSALLEGPYVGGDKMSTRLATSGVLPLISPYGADRRTVESIPSDTTDWVLVQLRRIDEIPVFSRSLFLRKDGSLIDESGSTNLAVDVSPGTNYSFVIKHRNHVPAMSTTSASFTNRNLSYDFTTSSSQYLGSTNAAVEVESGIWAMRSGDVDGDGHVQEVDVLVFKTQSNAAGYVRSDVNLDGVVDGNDLSFINNSLGTMSMVTNAEVNLRPSLRIAPPRKTLIEGESLTLTASEFSGPVTWAFVENNSGGSIDSNLGISIEYTAGNTSGVVDVMQAWDPSNRLAQTFLNVISSNEVAVLGQAIIVAGGLSEKDPVWRATDYLADKAFRIFEDRGFSDHNIVYLSLGPEKDVVGAGNEFNDIDIAGITSNDLELVFSELSASDTDRLTVYMVDHGSDDAGAGQFRLNGTELIPAVTVNTWLNDLQDRNTNLHVTVILDFCYSGSYLDELEYTNGSSRRIVISSTASDELAYFVVDGRISFSEYFFNGVLQGQSLLGAYELARDAMDVYDQNAWLDDTQDGVYQPGVDGVVASNQYIGASFIVGKDFPIIGTVLGNQSLSHGSSVRLWAENVDSLYELERVRCTILPPSYAADTNSGVPVVEVTTRSLIENRLTGRYETEFDGFTEQGQYTINYYAEDIWGSVSPPVQRFVVQDGFLEKVVLVAGGDASDTNTWLGVLSTACLAYRTLESRLIASSNIYVLSASPTADLDGDGSNDVVATFASVRDAIQDSDQGDNADRLTVYLIGASSDGDGSYQVSPTESISAVQLDGWLDYFQRSNRTVNVILEFPGSGGFIPELIPPPDRQRYTIASSDVRQKQVLEESTSFSTFLLSEISKGESLGKATSRARKIIRDASGTLKQKVLMDDTNNGIANEKNIDGVASLTQYIGSPFFTGEDIPNIDAVIPETILPLATNSMLLWADGVSDADGITNVWVEITSPTNFSGALSTCLELTNIPETVRWEKNYEHFSTPGIYTLTFYAMDRLSNVSAGVQTRIIRTDTNNYELIPGAQVDRFEPDNLFSHATYSDLPLVQDHTLNESNDCDWVRFFVVSNLMYDIETIHLGTNSTIDTVIEIYREESSLFDNPSAQPVWMKTVDEFGHAEGEQTGLDFPETGFYYVKVCQSSNSGYQAGSYLLNIQIPSGPEGITVHVWDVVEQEELSGAVVEVTGTNAFVSDTTESDGTVWFTNLPQGSYTVEVSVPHAGSHGPSYIPLFDPFSSSGVASNATSGYGNPRYLDKHGFGTVPYNDSDVSKSFSVLQFGFIPVAYVEAQLRDAITGEPVSGMELQITRADAENTVFSKVPWADYGQKMSSGLDGRFGLSAPVLPESTYITNKIVDAQDRYELRASEESRTSPAAGEVLDLGEIWVEPKMGTPLGTNLIPNLWESEHGIPIEDWGKTNVHSDSDGLSNLQEYIADTDPTDSTDVFRMKRKPSEDQGEFVVTWDAAPHRIYEIYKATDLNEESGWIKVHKVINTENLSTLSWTDPVSMEELDAVYRIVVTGIERARNEP